MFTSLLVVPTDVKKDWFTFTFIWVFTFVFIGVFTFG